MKYIFEENIAEANKALKEAKRNVAIQKVKKEIYIYLCEQLDFTAEKVERMLRHSDIADGDFAWIERELDEKEKSTFLTLKSKLLK